MNKWVKLAIFAVLIASLYGLSKNEFAQHLFNNEWLFQYVNSHGTAGHITIFLFSMLLVGMGGPKQIIAFSYGFIYGISNGIVLTMAIYIITAGLLYFFAKFSLKQMLMNYPSRKLQKFRKFVEHKAFLKILILRLFPIGSNLMTNIFAGSLNVPFLPFISASFLGYIPQVIIFCLAGAGIGGTSEVQVIVSIVLAVLSLVLTGYLYRHYIKDMVKKEMQ
ncbi:VTT domain-containing protein [Vibrio sp. SS-MA-C1-2]|uniref:TVP38/TMEM64 family protein n=1 Tax=Vibrio sp. SS-MA-C1-2 TaxID=2908646 RepID=UPI001F2989F6|nr:VTT domain-containing protein [Vibrio sp. SS-MA-C1-2]UJF17374.1 VTT domain-containing protein [Vibrio sp. SS-MA-C1-2]